MSRTNGNTYVSIDFDTKHLNMLMNATLRYMDTTMDDDDLSTLEKARIVLEARAMHRLLEIAHEQLTTGPPLAEPW